MRRLAIIALAAALAACYPGNKEESTTQEAIDERQEGDSIIQPGTATPPNAVDTTTGGATRVDTAGAMRGDTAGAPRGTGAAPTVPPQPPAQGRP